MELLESDSARPRQARYQAALRPDNPILTYAKMHRLTRQRCNLPLVSTNVLAARMQGSSRNTPDLHGCSCYNREKLKKMPSTKGIRMAVSGGFHGG
jgi:hypothetical protein